LIYLARHQGFVSELFVDYLYLASFDILRQLGLDIHLNFDLAIYLMEVIQSFYQGLVVGSQFLLVVVPVNVSTELGLIRGQDLF
jgi:hypothetical protein